MRISVARTLAMVRTRWKQGAAFYTTPVTKSKVQSGYDRACRDCPRLAGYLDQVRQVHPDSHARPVAPFGPKRAALLVVGLAPGLHGANRTGRPFTGDHAGILLYRTLHRYGFASHEGSSDPGDGLALIRSEEHTSELQSQSNLVCRLLLEKKKTRIRTSSSMRAKPSDALTVRPSMIRDTQHLRDVGQPRLPLSAPSRPHPRESFPRPGTRH